MEIEGIQPGQVLSLTDDLGEIPSGVWVVLEVNWMITLSRAGEDEDGNLCTTPRLVKVTYHEIDRFTDMHLTVEHVGG